MVRRIGILLSLLAALLSACAPGATTHTTELVEELAPFKTVVVFNIVADNGNRDPYSLEPLLIKELRSSGFEVMSESEYRHQGSNPLDTLFLYVAYYWTPALYGSFATVELLLLDILNQEIMRAQGTNAGLSLTADAQGAALKAVRIVSASYPGHRQSASSSAERRMQQWPRGIASEGQVRALYENPGVSLDAIEGVWASEDGVFRLGITPGPENSGVDFVGTILDTTEILWSRGMVRLEAERTATLGRYSVRYFSGLLEGVGRTIVVADGVITIPNAPVYPGEPPMDVRLIKVFPEIVTSSDLPSQVTSVETVVTGSGFLISQSGHIVTNAHVVDGKSEILVHLGEGEATFKASIILKDSANDIAILALENFEYGNVFSGPIPYSVLDGHTTAVGESVLALGFPLSGILGSSLRVTDGIVSAMSGIGGAPNMLQITNPLQPGNSGGPLFNMKGDVIGILVASLDAAAVLEATGTIPQNVNFAIKSQYLVNLIEMAPGVRDAIPRELGKQLLTGNEIVSLASRFMAFIQAK